MAQPTKVAANLPQWWASLAALPLLPAPTNNNHHSENHELMDNPNNGLDPLTPH